MIDFELREYTIDDLDGTIKNYTDIPDFFTERAVNLIKSDLEKVSNREDYFCIVAEKNGSIIGNLVGKRDYSGDDVYEFKWIGINPTIYNKSEILKNLMLSGEAILRKEGRVFYFYTSNTENEKRTQQLFGELGYEKCGVIADFWDEGDGRVTFAKKNPEYKKTFEKKAFTTNSINEKLKMYKQLATNIDDLIERFLSYDLSPENYTVLFELTDIVRSCNLSQLSKLILGILKRSASYAFIWVMGVLTEDFSKYKKEYHISLGRKIPNLNLLMAMIGMDFNDSPIKTDIINIYGDIKDISKPLNVYKTKYENMFFLRVEVFDSSDTDYVENAIIFTTTIKNCDIKKIFNDIDKIL